MSAPRVLFITLTLSLGLGHSDVINNSNMTSVSHDDGVNLTAHVCTCFSVTSRAYVMCTNVTSTLALLATGLDTSQVDLSGLLKHEVVSNCTSCDEQPPVSLLPVFSACPPLLSPCQLCWSSGDTFTPHPFPAYTGGHIDPGHVTSDVSTPSPLQLWQQIQEQQVRNLSDNFITLLRQGSVDVTTVQHVVSHLNDVISSASVTSLNNDTVQAIVDVYGDVMTVSTDVLTQAEIQHGTVTRCLTAMEHIGAAYDMNQTIRVDFVNEQFSVSLRQTWDDTDVTFTADDVMAGSGDGGRQAGIILPASALHAAVKNNNKSVLLQFVNFNNTVFFQVLTNLSTAVTSSRNVLSDSVVAAIVVSGSADLSRDPATVTIRPPSLTQGSVNDTMRVSCVWWNFTSSNWSTEGCHVTKMNQSRDDGLVTCQCSHLTNFALLMDVYRVDASNSSSEDTTLVISVASLLGCALSMAGTTLTLLTFAVFRQLLHDIPSKILFNLCAALLGMLIMFIVASDPGVISNESACKAVAVLLHYFVLVTWLWMANQGYFIYVAVIRTFPTYFDHFMRNTAIVAWGGPFLPIVITLVVGNTANYGSQGQLCWLSRDAFYGACLSIVLFIITANTVAFILILCQLRQSNVNVIQDLGSTSDQFKRRIRGAVGLFILLGLTWLFAIFAVGGAGVTFDLLFCFVNSTQGFFIFIVYCVASSDVRQAWVKAVTCHSCCHVSHKVKARPKNPSGASRNSAYIASATASATTAAAAAAAASVCQTGTPTYDRFYSNLTLHSDVSGSEAISDSAVSLTSHLAISRSPSSLGESIA